MKHKLKKIDLKHTFEKITLKKLQNEKETNRINAYSGNGFQRIFTNRYGSLANWDPRQ
ncbi:hypothetical protein FACS1894195_1720 [Bacteroidia bacterium]|nr:hypothetical protein FACS1894195_1720 [Bacteroidia bacterium]